MFGKPKRALPIQKSTWVILWNSLIAKNFNLVKTQILCVRRTIRVIRLFVATRLLGYQAICGCLRLLHCSTACPTWLAWEGRMVGYPNNARLLGCFGMWLSCFYHLGPLMGNNKKIMESIGFAVWVGLEVFLTII